MSAHKKTYDVLEADILTKIGDLVGWLIWIMLYQNWYLEQKTVKKVNCGWRHNESIYVKFKDI